MKKVKILTSFYHKGNTYQDGCIYNLEDSLADKLEKEKRIKIISSVTTEEIEKTFGGYEPLDDDIPCFNFYGTFPTTKDSVKMAFEYHSKTDDFSGYVDIKCQGTSSMAYPKKNFTIKLYEDENLSVKIKKDFKGWGKQNKFCLKANYIDTLHSRNIVGAKIGYEMVQSRPDSEFKQNLLTAPRGGLIDGFPIKVYYDGVFYGVYTCNIPKDAWMFNMDEDNPNHMVLCAEKNNHKVNGYVTSCEFRQHWDGVDGGEWSVEVGTLTPELLNSFNRLVDFVMTSSDDEFKENINSYFDVNSLIDYYIFCYFMANFDGLGKNMLLVTYDGVIWGTCLYDLDTIFGSHWQGTSFYSPRLIFPTQYGESYSLLWERVGKCFFEEITDRYKTLRKKELSLANIIKHIDSVYGIIPQKALDEEHSIWKELPSLAENTTRRQDIYMRDRSVYVDKMLSTDKIVLTNVLTFGSDFTGETKTITGNGTEQKITFHIKDAKPNKKYLIVLTITENTLNGNIRLGATTFSGTNNIYIEAGKTLSKQATMISSNATITDSTYTLVIPSTVTSGSLTMSKPVLLEYEKYDERYTIPPFEGTKEFLPEDLLPHA